MEFKNFIFQAWKVFEFDGRSWKIIITNGKLKISLTIKKVWQTEDVNLLKFDVSAILK